MEIYSHPKATGVAVVAAAAGGLEEVVIDGRTGFAFPAGSAPALAQAIRQGLDASADERARLHAAGHRLVAERYDYETNVAQFMRVVARASIVRP